MSMKELRAKAREIRELMRMKEEIEAEISSLQDEIKAHMADVEEIVAGEYKIRWTPVTSKRFDTTAFKATHKELYEQYTKATQSRRFSIA